MPYFLKVGTFMTVKEIKTDKKKYISLLLLADEQESMIDKYLERGTMYVGFSERTDTASLAVLPEDATEPAPNPPEIPPRTTALCECVVTDEGDGVLEIKNIATDPAFQGKGYAKSLISFVANTYRGKYRTLKVGTGLPTVPFYEKCGFSVTGKIDGFFRDNYDHEIWENGILLEDMIILTREI